jgi:hypothetical protein
MSIHLFYLNSFILNFYTFPKEDCIQISDFNINILQYKVFLFIYDSFMNQEFFYKICLVFICSNHSKKLLMNIKN